MIRCSFPLLIASEIFASLVGFVVMVTLARRLDSARFADLEYGAAIAAWWLVVVRGGFDTIVYREAARRPRLVGPLTDALIGLRLISAVVGLTAISTAAWVSGLDRGRVILLAGLVLIPSALSSDVGLRASCRFGALALSQAIRAIGLALGLIVFLFFSASVHVAAACPVGAETVAMVFFLSIHLFEHQRIRPRFRRKLWVILASRGAIAGASRFGRVTLYAADLLILGNLMTSTDLGPYAAARRVGFALLSLGLVVPAFLAPRFARAWVNGVSETRSELAQTCDTMALFVLPATIGLILTSDRWMSCLFGASFGEGGYWLALIAARIPFVLASNVQQAVLVGCRREGWSLGLMVGMIILSLVLIPPLAILRGAWGVAWGFLAIEACGALAGWLTLRRLQVAPRWHPAGFAALAGCVALATVCWAGRIWPLWAVVLIGATTYGLVALLARFPMRLGLPVVVKPLSPFSSGGPSS